MRRALLAVLLVAVTGAASPAPLLPPLDLARCQVSPDGAVAMAGDTITVTVRPGDSPLASTTIHFTAPQATAGADRLVLEYRAEEPTGTYLCLSRTTLLGEGEAAVDYEPDLLVPPTWSLREVLAAELPAGLPGHVRGLRLHFWAPGCSGATLRLHLRRLQWQSREELAAELRPGAPRRQALPVTRRADGPARWTNLGPGGGGWFRTVAFSPHDSTCFVGGDVGGVYRSRDRGRTWQICNTGLPNLYVNCFAFDPVDARTLYAGSNGGPLRSRDGGDTWQLLRTGLPPELTFGQSAPVSALLVDRANPRRVLAGIGHERGYGALGGETVGGRVFLSEDAGESWRPVPLPLGAAAAQASVLCLQQHPTDPAVLFATTPVGLCRSGDGGASWQALGGGLGGHKLCFLALRRDRPDTMLLSYHEGPGGPGGVLRSEDGGRTWSPRNTGLPATDKSAWRLVADPADPARFYLGYNSAAGLYTTGDGGDTWRPVSSVGNTRWTWAFAHATCTGLDIDPRDPQRLVFCDDIDLCQTLDGGRSWASVIADCATPATPDRPAAWHGRGCEIMCLTGPQAIAVDPSQPRTLFAGYWDLHAWRSDDGGQSFARMVDGITPDFGRLGAVLLDPANPDVMWLSVGANYDRQRLYQSLDGGRRCRLVGHAAVGLPPGGLFTLVLDPSSPPERRTLYAGVTEHGVYRSTDGGLTWDDANAGLPRDSRMVKQLALDPRDPARLYLAAGAHYHPDTRVRSKGYLAVSSDGGAHWRITKPEVEAQCILVDPTDPRRVYAGNRNYSGLDYPNALYRSEDRGESWTAVGQEAFAASPGPRAGDQGWRCYLSCLAADPTTPGLLYAGLTCEGYDVSNGRGVMVSRDYGATWQPLPLEGLSNYAVGTLVVDPVNPARLYVGTGGNGLFRFGPAP